jgi:Ferredoxin thioredoxin reductase variable alpha chain
MCRLPFNGRQITSCFGRSNEEMSDTNVTLAVGTRVRVKTSVVVYTHPEHRNQPFDIIGLEGTVAAIVREWQGRPVSANFPYQVKFTPKFKAHLQDFELEPI